MQLYKVGGQMDAATANNILRLIKMLFDKQGQVTMNGLIALQGFIVGIEGLGTQVDISEIAVYVKHALESQEKSLLQTTCGIVSDLANSMKDGINEYLGDFVPGLKNLLETDSVDR